jgi:alpha,alpha-trehalose phosphorylase (configuration-retaining)
MDIVPIVFNIKLAHSDSITRSNVKHRISSKTNSYVTSGAETPNAHGDPNHLSPDSAQLHTGVSKSLPIQRTLDEQADSAARKCIMYFGPGNNPRLSIGPRNQVTVDAAGKIHLIDDLTEYQKTVSKGTWNAVTQLADELREKKIKIAFFSSTPQGGKPCPLIIA